MNTSLFSLPRLVSMAFCMTLFFAGYAQKAAVWKGGAPGQENNWDCPKNWSSNRLPDEFSDVVIPDVAGSTRAFPVIRSGFMEINSLFIASNASLTVEPGAQLLVNDRMELVNPDCLRGRDRIYLWSNEQSTASAAAESPRRN